MAARLTSRLTQHPIFAAKGNQGVGRSALMSLVFHPPPSHTRGAAHGTMKLLTHNLLQSPGTRHGYPLAIEAEKVETVEIGRCRERVLASLQGLRNSEASRESNKSSDYTRQKAACWTPS